MLFLRKKLKFNFLNSPISGCCWNMDIHSTKRNSRHNEPRKNRQWLMVILGVWQIRCSFWFRFRSWSFAWCLLTQAWTVLVAEASGGLDTWLLRPFHTKHFSPRVQNELHRFFSTIMPNPTDNCSADSSGSNCDSLAHRLKCSVFAVSRGCWAKRPQDFFHMGRMYQKWDVLWGNNLESRARPARGWRCDSCVGNHLPQSTTSVRSQQLVPTAWCAWDPESWPFGEENNSDSWKQ